MTWISVARCVLVVLAASASAAPAAELCRESRWPQGFADAVATDGVIAVVGVGTALAVFDVTSPHAPAPLGAVSLPEYPRDIVLAGNLAYVAADAAGLRIVDLSAPSTPREIGKLETGGDAFGLAVSGTTAAVAADDAGLRIVDVSQPESPREIGSLVVPGNRVQDVALRGWHAYLADQSLGLRVVSVAVPRFPVELGSLPNDHGGANAVVVDGHLAYVGLARYFFNGGLRVVDVSSPRNPTELGYLDTAETINDMAVVGSLVLAAGEDDGLSVIDVSDPSSPTRRSESPTSLADRSVAVLGDRALLASNDVFRVVSFADPDLPVEEFTFPTKGISAEAVAIGSVAVVTDPEQGLWVYDLQRPGGITPLTLGQTIGRPFRMTSREQLVFTQEGSSPPLEGIHVYDLSDPSEPAWLGQFETDRGPVTVAAGHHEHVYATDASDLYVLDVSQPNAPTEVGRVGTWEGGVSIIVTLGHAFVGTAVGIEVIDVRAPSHPTSVQQIPLNGISWDADVAGNRLFVATSFDLTILDIAVPSASSVLGSVQIPFEALAVVVDPPFAYVASTSAGVQIVDVSDPRQPEIVGSWTTQEDVWDLALFGHRLLVPSRAGLEVLRRCGEIFGDGFESGDTAQWSPSTTKR